MTGIEKLRNLSSTLSEGQPFTLERIYIGGKTVSEWLADVADQIERETLPRPRFEDGEPVQFGDKYVDKYGNVATADTVVVSNHGFTLYNRGSATHFKLTESVKRPVAKVLDADGVEIKVGDEVWSTNDSGLVCHPFSFIVTEVEEHLVHGDGIGVLPCQVTHKRVEPSDSWERIEADAKKDPCDYFGYAGKPCRDGDVCPAYVTENGYECDKCKVIDLVRRCKALAGVE
jgi:hypothetical protein